MPVVHYRQGERSRDNPYAAPANVSDLDTPDYGQGPTEEYTAAAPGYPSTNDGWSPELRTSTQGIPDAERIGLWPILGFRGKPSGLARFYRRKDADDARRHSVEQIDTDGTPEGPRPKAAEGITRFAPNPRSVPPPESRVTQGVSPSTYSFWRPFGFGGGGVPKVGAKNLNGEHFSMANHRREYDIYGMQPRRSWRNTYRLTPEPWDEDIVDMPAPEDASVNAVYVENVVTQPYSRSFRLG